MRYGIAIAAIVLMGSLAVPVASASEQGTIAVVDVKRLLTECKYRTEYERRIEDLRTRKQQEVQTRYAAVQQRLEEIKQAMSLLTEEAKEEKRAEAAAELKQFREFERQASEEVNARGMELLKDLEEKVRTSVETMAVDEGLTLVLNSAAVLFSKDIRDITDKVLERLDAAFDKELGGDSEPTEPAAGESSGEGG